MYKSSLKYIIPFFIFILSNGQIIYELKDTSKVEKKQVIGGKFDLFYRHTFLITGQWTDTIPLLINGTGSNYYGISINFTLSPKYRLLLQSHVNAFKLLFQQTAEKRFPTIGDSSYTMEKYRFLYGGIGMYLTRIFASTSERKRIISEAGIGTNLNLLLASTKKFKEPLKGTNRSRIIKEPKISDANLWRIELNAFYRYRWLGLWTTYRLTSLYKSNRYYTSPMGYSYLYPKFPKWEIGFMIIL